MVTPVLRIASTGLTRGATRLLSAKWVGAKCRVLVEGECAGCRVDVRTSPALAETSLLVDRQALILTAEGKATIFLEDDADIGKTAAVVLFDASGQVIDSLTTTLGE